jgi:hypothetical protein
MGLRTARGPADSVRVDWSRTSRLFQVTATLGVTQRTVARLVADGVLATRIDPVKGHKVYSTAQVAALAATRSVPAVHPTGLGRAARRRARAWAERELARQERKRFHALYLQALERERGSPAGTGNPPTSAHS